MKKWVTQNMPGFLSGFLGRVLLVVALAGAWTDAVGCTSALVGMERGADGRWLLWKHRDSGHADNYALGVEATDSTMAYVALFNAADSLAREAWIGFNSAGFAVMNTASYNIPAPRKGWADREGLLMSEALRHCRSVDDFRQMLAGFAGPRGVQANFGAVDASGNGAYFETDDYGMVEYSLADDPSGMITRTNYSCSGGSRKRLGMSRHRAENHLLDSLMAAPRQWADRGEVAAEDFIETLSRSLYLPAAGVELTEGDAPSWPDNGDVISRRSSCASVVIEGPKPGEDPAQTMIMWVAIGFPTLSVVEPVMLDSVPASLLPHPANCHSELCDSVKILREKAFIKARNARSGYAFNLPYLRREIPSRRALSLPHYDPARLSRRR